MKRFLLCVLGCLLLCGGLVFASDHKVRNADTRDNDNNANNIVQLWHDNADSPQSFSPYVVTKPSQIGTGTADVILKATTAATGTNWTAFASQACSAVSIGNTTGTTISVRIGGAGQTFEIKDGGGYTFNVAANANELAVQRADTSNTQVDVKAIAVK